MASGPEQGSLAGGEAMEAPACGTAQEGAGQAVARTFTQEDERLEGLDVRDAAAGIPDCRTCGACCAFSREWPRFGLESEAALARIPAYLVDDEHGRMRCEGERCAALKGEVGVATGCAVYEARPDVCRECQPGDGACLMARRSFGL